MTLRTLLLALLGSCFGCHGTLTLGALDAPSAPSDDDDATGDDDDATGDDDDTTGDDDDDATPDLEGVVGVFSMLGLIHHPEGRYAQGVSYFFLDESEAQAANASPPQSLPRGGEYGCEARTPDDDARGGEVVTFDAGTFTEVWMEAGGWSFVMERIEDAGTIYYFGSSLEGQPAALPPGRRLNLYVPGGDDIPSFELAAALPTQEPFPVSRPALRENTEQLLVDPDDGLEFVWEPRGEAGIGIGLEFASPYGDISWAVECWVEDSGSFVVEPGLVRQMPEGMTGATWIRRIRGGWVEAAPGVPPIYAQGALQHHWYIELRDDAPLN